MLQVEKAGMTIGMRAVPDKGYDMDELEVRLQPVVLQICLACIHTSCLCTNHVCTAADPLVIGEVACMQWTHLSEWKGCC
jgi:hypothetical protein